MFGYKANRLLVVGDSFANTATDLDAFHPGRAVSAADLQPFTITLDKFEASYVTSGALRGQPSQFDALIRYSPQPGAPMRGYRLRVNHPLAVDGVRVFLIGHGYAPVFRVTDGTGRVVFDGPVPFIAVEQAGLTSEGVIKVPDAHPQQLGFAGVFLPTAVDVGGKLGSAFPAPLNPAVSLVSYAGNLGMNSGPPQSVYQLDTTGLHQLPISPRPLAPGQSMKLPDGDGTLTFTGYRQWISLAITYDPGTLPALIAALTALAGLLLSFFVRRRRMFVRAAAVPGRPHRGRRWAASPAPTPPEASRPSSPAWPARSHPPSRAASQPRRARARRAAPVAAATCQPWMTRPRGSESRAHQLRAGQPQPLRVRGHDRGLRAGGAGLRVRLRLRAGRARPRSGRRRSQRPTWSRWGRRARRSARRKRARPRRLRPPGPRRPRLPRPTPGLGRARGGMPRRWGCGCGWPSA